MLDYARDCLAGRNLSGLLATAQNLPQVKILNLLESALRSKKEWAWPHLLCLIEPHYQTSVLSMASVYGHRQCFDTVFNTLNWNTISADIRHDLITRCATHNDTYGFLKIAPFVPMRTCSHIAAIAVRRNNPEILAHILSHTVLSLEEQRRSIVAAVEMEHETCVNVLLPYTSHLTFDKHDIHNMMHHVGGPVDLLEKISHHFTQKNFNTLLHLACLDGNEDVLEFAFPHAQASKVLQELSGQPSQLLQERINRAQKDRLLRCVKNTPDVSVRKM